MKSIKLAALAVALACVATLLTGCTDGEAKTSAKASGTPPAVSEVSSPEQELTFAEPDPASCGVEEEYAGVFTVAARKIYSVCESSLGTKDFAVIPYLAVYDRRQVDGGTAYIFKLRYELLSASQQGDAADAMIVRAGIVSAFVDGGGAVSRLEFGDNTEMNEYERLLKTACEHSPELGDAILACTAPAEPVTPKLSELVSKYLSDGERKISEIGYYQGESMPVQTYLERLRRAESFADSKGGDMSALEEWIADDNEKVLSENSDTLNGLTVLSVTDRTEMYIWSVPLQKDIFTCRTLFVTKNVELKDEKQAGAWNSSGVKSMVYELLKDTESDEWRLFDMIYC